MKIVLASNNAGKLSEFQSLLAGYDVDIVPGHQLNVGDVEETGSTFIENALIKARHACVQTGLPAIADDSGLIVPALKGEPGVHSARYSGGDAEDNIQHLLKNMQGLTGDARLASFYCVIVYLTHVNDPTPIICQGSWSGSIVEQRVGKGGFGYDSVFYVPSCELTAAQLPANQKNQLSHRGKACSQLLEKLSDVLQK